MKICRYRNCLKEFVPPSGAHGSVAYCSDECRNSERLIRGREHGRAYYSRNREARKAAAAEWRSRNPDASLRARLVQYGLTAERYDQLLAAQGNACAICGVDDPGYKSWHIDHDHACCSGLKLCGECVRGLLCFRCNSGLGNFRDNPNFLRAAIEYLGAQ